MGSTEPDRDLRDQCLIGLATLVGFALRIWPVGRLGFNQFDEGVYGMAALSILQPGGLASINPSLIAYAPPGYPILVGMISLFLGSSDQPSFLVSAILGSLTIPIVAWISRHIFGQKAAVVSAWCICLSGPHIAFSRMGLVDASFLFFFGLGLIAGIRFLEEPRFSTSLMMGILVGLAQQFKYNGWLVGAFVIITTILAPFVSKPDRDPRRWGRFVAWGCVAVVIAWIVVYPWFRFVEVHGGYLALLKHQRSYLTGWSSWWPNLIDQANQAVGLAGPVWLMIIAGSAIGVSHWSTSINLNRRDWRRPLRSISVGWLATTLLASPITSGLLFVPRLLFGPEVGIRFIGSGWLVLFVLSPFYHPYARLWLPFEMFHWIILGGVAAKLDDSVVVRYPVKVRWASRVLSIGLFAVLSLGFLSFGPGFPFVSSGRFGHPGLFDPSDSLRLVALDVAKQVPSQVQGLRTLVRPALSYYLAGRVSASAQSNLNSFNRYPNQQLWGLIDSSILSSELGRDPATSDRSLLDSLMGRWEIVAEFPSTTNLPTSFDLDPDHSRRSHESSLTYVWLLRPRTLDTPK